MTRLNLPHPKHVLPWAVHTHLPLPLQSCDTQTCTPPHRLPYNAGEHPEGAQEKAKETKLNSVMCNKRPDPKPYNSGGFQSLYWALSENSKNSVKYCGSRNGSCSPGWWVRGWAECWTSPQRELCQDGYIGKATEPCSLTWLLCNLVSSMSNKMCPRKTAPASAIINTKLSAVVQQEEGMPPKWTWTIWKGRLMLT